MPSATRRQFLATSAGSFLGAVSGLQGIPRESLAATTKPVVRPNLLYGLTTGSWSQVTTPGEPLPLLSILDETAAAGFNGIRLTGYPAILEKNALSEEQLGEELAKRGLLFSTSSFGGEFRDPAQHDAILRRARQMLAMHRRFGCTAATFFPSSAVKPGEDEAEAYDNTFRFLARLGKMAAEEYGVRLGVHNLPGSLVSTQKQVDRYLENTDPRYVFCAWDICHLYLDGCDVASTLKRSIDRLVYLDLTDAMHQPSSEDYVAPNGQRWEGGSERANFLNAEWEIGRGEIDFPTIYKVLKSAGYRGWVTHDLHSIRVSTATSWRIAMSYINRHLDPIYQ